MKVRPALRGLRRVSFSLALAACASVLGVALYLAPLNSVVFANRIEDYRLHVDALTHASSLGLPNVPSYDQPNDSIALVTIDEESIGNASAGLGPFPFPRGVYGTLLKRLARAGAKDVAFDIDFLESSQDPSEDAAFAAAARAVPTVVGYTVTTTSAGILGAEVPPRVLRDAMKIGFTTIDTPGGLVIGQPLRIAPLPKGFAGGAATSLALAAAQSFRGAPIDLRGVPTLDGAMLLAPFYEAGNVDISRRLGAQVYNVGFVSQSMSFADALTIPLDQLRVFAHGRLVLIGATAQALGNFAPTIAGLYPGVYVQARFMDQLLSGTYVWPAPAWLDLALIVLLPLLVVSALSQLRPTFALALAAAVVLLYIELTVALFVYRLYWLDTLHAAGAMLLASLAIVAYRVVTEAAQRHVVTNLFGRHVSPAVVEEILKSDDPIAELGLTGKRAKVTIFYSDIRGFTMMSERMTPEAIHRQLNEYFEAMCDVIFKHGGYIDKFIGDCLMAVFSAPAQTPGDARKAVNAALDQQALITELGKRWQADGKQPFTVGMGINTGYVVLGNLGSQVRMNYTVIGDDVNIAARLYSIAEGGQIIISESTCAEVKDFFTVRELDPVTVKGKGAPLRNFEVLGRR